MMRNFLIFCLLMLTTACSTVPVTGRSQLNLIPVPSMLAMSLQQYDQYLKENKLSTDQAQTQLVRRVGFRISGAVERYLTAQGMQREIRNFAWEFNLIEGEQVNAWCMPGGKVVVYTGLLPVANGEEGLAVVLGHEIAHAVAQHGNERMSQQLLASLGGVALSTALATRPAETQQLWMTVYGVGAQYGALLPYGRLHENEADHLGLLFMTMAGYDPRAAVGFWERMSSLKGGQSSPEFLSTHPSDAARIANIRQLIPKILSEAQAYQR